MMIESLHDRSINKQNMHAFTLYHISLQRKIHVNSITFVQDSISCCFITIIGEQAFSGSNIGLPCCFVLACRMLKQANQNEMGMDVFCHDV